MSLDSHDSNLSGPLINTENTDTSRKTTQLTQAEKITEAFDICNKNHGHSVLKREEKTVKCQNITVYLPDKCSWVVRNMDAGQF